MYKGHVKNLINTVTLSSASDDDEMPRAAQPGNKTRPLDSMSSVLHAKLPLSPSMFFLFAKGDSDRMQSWNILAMFVPPHSKVILNIKGGYWIGVHILVIQLYDCLND